MTNYCFKEVQAMREKKLKALQELAEKVGVQVSADRRGKVIISFPYPAGGEWFVLRLSGVKALSLLGWIYARS
jgi:hypothetical protein